MSRVAAALSSRLYAAELNYVDICGFLVLPPLLTFGAGGARYEPLFRPPPSNDYYDAMFVAVGSTVAATDVLIAKWLERRSDALGSTRSLFNAFTFFKLYFALIVGVMNCVAGAAASGVIWLVFAAALVFTTYKRGRLRIEWRFTLRGRTAPDTAYAVFSAVIAAAFFAFPVLQPWTGRPEPFVRWHPFSVLGELVWRGIFSAYALAFLYAAAEGTAGSGAGKHTRMAVYTGVSGVTHALVMLAMNLADAARGLPNGNAEHLYGDVVGWFLIGAVNALYAWWCIVRSPARWGGLPRKSSDPDVSPAEE